MSTVLDTHVGGDGIWCQLLRPPSTAKGRAALFLDRDGVIVEEVGYLHRVEDTRLVAGAAGLIRRANKRAMPVVVVTNQSGIGREMYGWQDFAAVQEAMLRMLAAEAASVDAVYACPFFPEHPDRKPQPGMLLRAARAFDLRLGTSWIVGDRPGDMQAGRAAGLAGGVTLAHQHGAAALEEALAVAGDDFAVRHVPDMTLAAAAIPPLRARS